MVSGNSRAVGKEGTIDTPVGQKLYWDYYCFVLEHPVDRWNVDTRILFGAKDNLVEFDTIHKFTEIFPCTLEIMDDGEHYFHTDEQLDVFKQWLEKNIE